MKALTFFLLMSLSICESFGQVSNVKAGLWSDHTVWSNNLLPTSIDDVDLNFDIIVDINAACQSLTINGHNITVNSGVNLNITGTANATILSMYIEIDTTAIAPLDTLSKMNFHYDNAKRNTGIDLFYYEDGVVATQEYKATFFYNGNDTLPFKRIYITPFLENTDPGFANDTCFFFYADSKLITDSSVHLSNSSPHAMVNNYVYNNAGIIRTLTHYNYDPVFTYVQIDTIYLERLNGNITKQNDTSYQSTAPANNFKFDYDNHPNPFYRTQNKITFDNTYPIYSIETFIEDIFEKNNAVEINQFQGTSHYHTKHVYEYRANGYPKIVRYYDQNSPTSFGKALYFYSN